MLHISIPCRSRDLGCLFIISLLLHEFLRWFLKKYFVVRSVSTDSGQPFSFDLLSFIQLWWLGTRLRRENMRNRCLSAGTPEPARSKRNSCSHGLSEQKRNNNQAYCGNANISHLHSLQHQYSEHINLRNYGKIKGLTNCHFYSFRSSWKIMTRSLITKSP